MSDVLDTDQKRQQSDSKGWKTRSEALGKKRKIDRSKDELELGRFVGDNGRTSKRSDKAPKGTKVTAEVVGPKRQNVETRKPKVERADGKGEMRIAAPLTIDDTPITPRPRAKRRSQLVDPPKPSWGRRIALALIGILLVLMTAATFILLPRYEFPGEPLLAKSTFEDGFGDWEQAGQVSKVPDDPAAIILESADPGTRTYLVRDIDLPPGERLLVLSAEVQGDDVVAGPEIWDTARIYLAQIDAEGAVDWAADHELFGLEGSTGTRRYSRAFSIPAEVRTVRLGIELKNASGRLTVSGLELAAAERPETFMMAAGGLFTAWGLLVLYTAFRTLRGIRSVGIRVTLIIACALSIAALLLPGRVFEGGLEGLALPFGFQDVDALGHAVVFAFLPFLVRLGRPHDPLWLHAGTWILIAIASEVVQLFTFDREPSMDDLMVDGIGLLSGLVLAEIICRIRKPKRSRYAPRRA